MNTASVHPTDAMRVPYATVAAVAVASIVATLIADTTALSERAIASLPVLTGLSPSRRFAVVVSAHSMASAALLTTRIVAVALVLQFVMAIHGVEVPLRRLTQATAVAAWAILGERVTQLVAAMGGTSGTSAGIMAIPGSLLQFVGARGPNLGPTESVLNSINGFECLWILLVARSLAWTGARGLAPWYVAVATWLIVTVSKWLVLVVFAGLAGR